MNEERRRPDGSMPTRRKSHWAELVEHPVERIGGAVKPVQRRAPRTTPPAAPVEWQTISAPIRPARFAEKWRWRSRWQRRPISARAARRTPSHCKGGASKDRKTGSRQPAQTEAGHGDAQLRGAEVGGRGAAGCAGPAARGGCPATISASNCVSRNLTKANSAATKKPLARTMASMAKQTKRVGGQERRCS